MFSYHFTNLVVTPMSIVYLLLVTITHTTAIIFSLMQHFNYYNTNITY